MTIDYVALIGDAIASRELPTPRRARLQHALRAALPAFNRRWRNVLAARFALTLGDEFQCLLTGPAPVWEIVHTVRAQFADVDWVIACGQGPIATPLPRGVTAPEVDGPCFHAARTAMDAAKRHRLVLVFAGFGASDPVLAALASYYSALYWSWTPRQRHAAKLLRAGGAAAAAHGLRVHRSAVSHLGRRMAWPLVAAGDTIFENLLGGSRSGPRA